MEPEWRQHIELNGQRMKTAMVLTLIAWIDTPAHANAARDIRHDLDQYMERITVGGFSGAILVVKDGRVILSRGYGKLGPRARTVTHEVVAPLPYSQQNPLPRRTAIRTNGTGPGGGS
jgi:hypothetical protein